MCMGHIENSVIFVGPKLTPKEMEALKFSGFFAMLEEETDKIIRRCKNYLDFAGEANKNIFTGEYRDKTYLQWCDVINTELISMSKIRIWKINNSYRDDITQEDKKGLVLFNELLDKTWEVA